MSSNSSTCTPAIVVIGAGVGGDDDTAAAGDTAIGSASAIALASLGSPSTLRLPRSIAAIIFSFQLPRFRLPLAANGCGDDASPPPFLGAAVGRFGFAGDVGAESPRGDCSALVTSPSERLGVSGGSGAEIGTTVDDDNDDVALLGSGADATGTADEAVDDAPSLTIRDETTRSESGGDAGVTAMVGVFCSSRRPRQFFI